MPTGEPIDRERYEHGGCGGGRLRWLLGHAAPRAKSEHQIAAGDADDFAAGKKCGELVESNAVVRVVEGRHDDEIIRYVEVRVARGQAEVVEFDRCGHRKRFDVEWAAVGIFHRT